MQQVGNALGVAVTGVIFFGALDGGFGHAFEVSLIQLAVLGGRGPALTRLLPGREAHPSGVRRRDPALTRVARR